MRSLLAASFVLAVGCSNACPAPVACTEPHPSYCPCLAADTGPVVRNDAFVDRDAFADDADIDAASDLDAATGDDAALDAGADDAGTVDAASIDDANVDANTDAHHP